MRFRNAGSVIPSTRCVVAASAAPKIMPRLRRLSGEERGSELVEFAVTSMLFFTALLGVVGFANAVYAYHYVTYAAQQGARFAIVRGIDWTGSCSTSAPPSFAMKYSCIASSADVQNYVRSLASPGIVTSNVAASTSWPATTPDCTSSCSACSPSNSAGCFVKVAVSYTFDFSLGLLPHSALSLSATSQKVIQE